jgi:hypothetical protein
MSLFADPPPAAGIRPELTAAEGLRMPDYPLHGRGFGVVGTITPLVDLWLDEGRLPGYTRLIEPARP